MSAIVIVGMAAIAVVVYLQWLVSGQTGDVITAEQPTIRALSALLGGILIASFSLIALLVVRHFRENDQRAEQLARLVDERTRDLAAREADASRRNRALSIACNEAVAASEAKSHLLASVSHEIRTPMNGVVGTAGLMMRTHLTPKQHEYAQTIYSSGMSLLKILDQVLDFSRLDAGKLVLDSVNFTVHERLADISRLFAAEAGRKRLTVGVAVADSVPDSVRGDPVRLGQILANLVSNAIKFSANGEISVHCECVDCDRISRRYHRLKFTVTDCGIGIAAADQDKLFQEFSQIEDCGTGQEAGSGLGLAICKELVTLMGGDIGVESEPGKGSRFWFTVMVARPEPDAALLPISTRPAPAKKPAPVQDVPADRSSQTVLVVDDNEGNLLVAKCMLEELGYAVDTAISGEQAVEANAAGGYAAILMDSQLGGMSGEEATRSIRSREPADERTPIIAFTANVAPAARERAFAAGVDDYLSKPLFIDKLEAALENAIRQRDTGTSKPARIQGPALRDSDRSKGVLDLATVDELRGIRGPGDADLFSALANQFVRGMPGWLHELEQAAKGAQTREVRRLSHSLLGVCRQIGAERMAALCLQIERIDAEANEEKLLTEVSRLRSEFEAAHRAMDDGHLGS